MMKTIFKMSDEEVKKCKFPTSHNVAVGMIINRMPNISPDAVAHFQHSTFISTKIWFDEDYTITIVRGFVYIHQPPIKWSNFFKNPVIFIKNLLKRNLHICYRIEDFIKNPGKLLQKV